jgi:hypothetical protein
MKRSFAMALAVLAAAAASQTASAQAPVQCDAFGQLRSEAEQKALAVRASLEHKAERKDVCAAVQRFYAAEGNVLKFLEDNKTWCSIPEQAIKAAKESHERTLKFRTAACTEAPVAKPRVPTLSDAIGTPSVDTGNNTKTGRGTLDTLNGNPLAK